MIRETYNHGRWDTIDFQRFESMTEWYNFAEQLPMYQDGCARSDDRSFFGHRRPREAAQYCKTMDESHLKPARELLDKIDSSFRDRERTTWQASPHGAYAVVPEYLANEPFNMRQKAREENDHAPIRYYIECGISAGVELREMERRAAAIAALIMRTVEERPCELNVFGAWSADDERRGQITVIPVDTHPIDLIGMIASIGTREFCRALMFANLESKFGSQRSIPWLIGYPGNSESIKAEREKALRKFMGLDPADVIMQGGALHDAVAFDRDPVAWVHTQIEKQRRIEE